MLVAAQGVLPRDLPKAELVLKDGDGHKVRLSDFRGKPVVLNFWATWCIPCNAEMPILVEAERVYGSRGVVFIGASLDDSKTKRHVPEFVSKYAVPFAIWLGAGADDLDRLELGNAVPATVFIDREGRIAARVLGQMTAEELKERAEWLVAPGQPAPPPLVKHLESK